MMLTKWLAGADGCHAGWVVVSADSDFNSVSWRVIAALPELLVSRPAPAVVALDIPIGLPASGPRACDQEARKLLGPRRGSSVFPAPIRPVLAAGSYLDACRIRYTVEAKKMSQQAWNIVSKISAVDRELRASSALRRRVREVHPEVCFYYLAGERPLQFGKKKVAGRAERVALLEPVFGTRVQAALADCASLGCQKDDMLDAFAALWTARRILRGAAQVLPARPPRDPFGLPMAITA